MNTQITFDQAFALHKSGKLDEAERLYRSIVDGRPGIGNDAKPYARATHFLGVLLVARGHFDDAVALIERSIALRPKEAEFHRNLALTLVNGGRPQDVERAYVAAQRALPSFADDPVIHEYLARVAAALGKFVEAAQVWRRVAELMPGKAPIHLNAAILFQHAGAADAAIEDLRKVLQLQPDHPNAMNRLATLFGAVRNPKAAFALLEHLDTLNAVEPINRALHAYLLIIDGQITRGEAIVETVPVALPPPEDVAGRNFAQQTLPYVEAAYLGAGHLEKSLATSALYCALDPADEHGLARHVSSAQYAYPDDPVAHRAMHERFDRDIAASIEVMPLAPMSPLAGRRLRVGYLSGDFRAHSVASFIEPLLANHDHARVEVTLFHNSNVFDATSARLRASADRWHDVVQMSDDDLARLVRASQIDVLLDLSGHTGGARLRVVARRPAPVQASYLGYSSTTGLAAIDGFITDEVCDPPGNETHFTERVLRLPHVLGVFRPPAGAPDVTPAPAQAAGYVTLGSVSALRKINDAVLDAWSIALRAVPTARLVVIGTGFGDPTLQSRFRQRLNARGIEDARIRFVGPLAFEAYLEIHGQIDLMLDTFPFTGHTTTVQNLWMGVPVVTFAGNEPPCADGGERVALDRSRRPHRAARGRLRPAYRTLRKRSGALG